MTRRSDLDDAPLDGGEFDPLAGVMPKLDDAPGPARRLSSARSARMVTDILDAALAPVADQAPPAPVVRPRRTVGLLAVALVAVAVVSASAAVIATRLAAPQATTPMAPAATPPSPAPAPTLPVETPRTAIDPSPSPAPSPAPPAPTPRPTAPVLDDVPAADLLALANQQRKDHAWSAADAAYRQVIRRFPGTDAAVVALVASATLHLEHLGDPSGARASYRRALAGQPRGPLAEEARWGLAEVARALDDRPAEVAALIGFLDHHADSALAPAARRRLATLSPAP